MNRKSTKNQALYKLVNNSLCYLIAINRGLEIDTDEKQRLFEKSFFGISRLLFYSQLYNDFSRVDHELKYTNYYLQLLLMQRWQKLKCQIITDPSVQEWAVSRLSIINAVEKILEQESNKSQLNVDVKITAVSLSEKRTVVITAKAGDVIKKSKIKIRPMKPNKSNYYMLEDLFPKDYSISSHGII